MFHLLFKDVATLMELGAVPLLVQTIPKYPEALKVLRYAIEDGIFHYKYII